MTTDTHSNTWVELLKWLPLQKVNLHGKTRIFISAVSLYGPCLVAETAE